MILRTYLKIAVPLLVVVGLSCNLFSPKEPDQDKWYMTGEAWIIEGKKKMWEEDWEGAIEKFNKAISLNSGLSEAYFYKGKCILRLHYVDLHQVWDDINPEDTSKVVPFLYNPNLDLPDTADSIDIMEVIAPYTLYLYDSRKGGYDTISATIRIDSAFLERKRIYDAVCQAIRLLDTIHYDLAQKKIDGIIKRAQYESDYLIEISVKTILGIPDYNNNERLDWEISDTLNERRAFRIMCLDIPSLDDMEFDSLKTISKNPRDIKENLDQILQSLNKADSSYNNFKDDLLNGEMDTTMAEDLGDMIENFKKILPYFYYDDFRDNDEDWWDTNKNGVMDRMIWIDWNRSLNSKERIDVDQAGTLHIGDSVHMFPNGVDSSSPPFYGLDTSLYEWVDTSDKDFRRYKYKGPYTYEFIGGDWGVDEEVLDGEDNDNDELVDEDTRISADTLDDDGDWFNTDKTIPTDTTNAIWPHGYQPMKWVSTDNFTIEITGALWDSVSVDPEYTFLHNTDGVDSLDHYPIYNFPGYLGYPDQFDWPNKIARYNGTDTLTQLQFKGGDYGMDEEWYDGLDNDKDGLYDEDVGELVPPESMRQDIITQLEQLGVRR